MDVQQINSILSNCRNSRKMLLWLWYSCYSKMKTENKCYACNAVATSKEHVPPKSFFPENYRANLITVPSCNKHNNVNSKDVEYVYSYISTPIQTQETGREHFSNVLKSFRRNPNLKNLVYKNVKEILLPSGEKTGLVTIDLKRFNSIMRAIAHAIYYHEFKKAYVGHFTIFSTSMISTKPLTLEADKELSFIRNTFAQMKFAEIEMPQPKIFYCGVYTENSDKFIYEFVFYGGFKVYAASMPFYYRSVEF